MSNSKVFGYRELHASIALALEHGHSEITITVMRNAGGEHTNLSVLLSPDHARQLALDLIRRAQEIDRMGEEQPQ